MTSTDKQLEYNRRYRERHAGEISERRKAKYKKKQDAILITLITEYVEGATMKELADKYKVLRRK